MTTNDIITLHSENQSTTVSLVRETPKAFLVKGNASEAWFPKSALSILGKDEVTGNWVADVADWFLSRVTMSHCFLFEVPFKA